MSNNWQAKRREWRKRLRSWGMADDEIELCIQQVAQRQKMKAAGVLPIDAPLCTRAEYVRLLRKQPGVREKGSTVLRLGDDYQAPNDKGYQPTRHDSVLTGVGRATGATAKAVKRGKTITKYEHDGGTAN